MGTCSKCDEPSVHSILVRKGYPPTQEGSGPKDKSRLHVLEFCVGHWAEIAKLLPALP